ncbi:hypothetical protein AM1_0310 [Acaryochloris marina MBIC11017]|uniref:Uncharacterized protein n=1 Tax=Acaryochloris marina (strain MBIC 11017) TaxID=329726 RepID=B0C8Y8_ACAM1|nr:hypothetical protein AM1_0310 [Acaryochloris marina MBIC11017]
MVKRKVLVDTEPVRIDFHLNGSFTRLKSLQFRRQLEIPTQIIPAHLRAIGSCFFLTQIYEYPEPGEEGKPCFRWQIQEKSKANSYF